MSFGRIAIKLKSFWFYFFAVFFLGCVTGNLKEHIVIESSPAAGSSSTVKKGSNYCDFTGTSLTGEKWTLSEFVGSKPIVLQFWGVRCSPCLAEMKLLSELQDKVGAQKLLIVGVNTDRQSPEHLAEAMTQREIHPSYKIVIDDDLSASRQYTDWLMPVVVVLDRQGIVQFTHTGYSQNIAEEIESEILRQVDM